MEKTRIHGCERQKRQPVDNPFWELNFLPKSKCSIGPVWEPIHEHMNHMMTPSNQDKDVLFAGHCFSVKGIKVTEDIKTSYSSLLALETWTARPYLLQ